MSRRVYRLLLKLYPAGFREDYGAPLERQFADEYREARGNRDGLRFWARTMADLVRSLPRALSRELRQDLAYSVRLYAARPLITVLAVGVLALAIGATTGTFSVVNALLLRSLPFRDSDRLVSMRPSPGMKPRAEFHQWRTQGPYLEDAVLFDSTEMNMARGSESVRVKVTETSANFFETLGGGMSAGRGFGHDEDVPGGPAVAVIGHGLWRRAFGGDASAIGSAILLNGKQTTVIGVAAPGFDYPSRTAVWTPSTFDFERYPKTGVTFWETVGRVRPGLTLARATSMFRAEMISRMPADMLGEESNRPRLTAVRDQIAGPVRQASLVLFGAVAFVLLIACANVANLLLTRQAERRRELVIRAALGASRARLARQLLTESVLLSVAAAGLGLLVAEWVVRVARVAQPVSLGAQEYSVLDWRVLAFTMGVALATGLAFGAGPAVLACRWRPTEDIVRGRPGAGRGGAGRLRWMLIGAQVALAVVLLAGSVTMGRGFLRLLGTDLGFAVDRVVTMSVSLAGTRHDGVEARRLYVHEAVSRLRALPQVEAAGATDNLPLGSNMFSGAHYLLESGKRVPYVSGLSVTPGLFGAMGTSMVAGRDFTDADTRASAPVAIVNERFVEAGGETRALVGQRIRIDMSRRPGTAPREFTVVGIVRTMAYGGPSDGDGHKQVFVPFEQRATPLITFAARVRGNPDTLLAACRGALQSVDPQVPVFDTKTLDERLADVLARPRFYVTAVLFFGGFALWLALTGIYGVAAYAVAQRTHEIGVRLAVGATIGGVRLLLVRQGLVPIALGTAAGVAGAMGLGRFLEHLMASARQVDATAYGASALLLVAAAAAAAWWATSRIVRVNPIDVLRAE